MEGGGVGVSKWTGLALGANERVEVGSVGLTEGRGGKDEDGWKGIYCCLRRLIKLVNNGESEKG